MKGLVLLSMAAAAFGLASGADCDLVKFTKIATKPTSTACTKSTGYSLISAASPTSAQLAAMCKNLDCWSSIMDLYSEFPTECRLTIGAGSPLLRETTINRFLSDCAARPASGNACGSDQDGVKACPPREYCQPWNPWYYQCRRLDAQCGTQEVGIDFYGDDLYKFTVRLPEECCELCTMYGLCEGYTFVNYNPDGLAYCYLKKGSGTRTKKVGAVSARMP